MLGYLSELGDDMERMQTKLELAVHRLKEGASEEAAELLSEVKTIPSRARTFAWITEHAPLWAEAGLGLDVRAWLDGLIEYWQALRAGDFEKAGRACSRAGDGPFRQGPPQPVY